MKKYYADEDDKKEDMMRKKKKSIANRDVRKNRFAYNEYVERKSILD